VVLKNHFVLKVCKGEGWLETYYNSNELKDIRNPNNHDRCNLIKPKDKREIHSMLRKHSRKDLYVAVVLVEGLRGEWKGCSAAS
jgi:hypothetical protein